ncbi:hypothetical protein F5J12DRAFT_780632 [Pisolithus orientalis]|uniref:uncharacterized protein n=1 Tax=Pisolithus orientalis TaxID=936130 RepID=UPI002225522C|nr:uncharacterized protein F5J12DRAFT_780632 [Pisolithus orientalis]KAI6025848.1 hypothetical protein F5J12DRAFT_780632 [Pisolithus orientalis]
MPRTSKHLLKAAETARAAKAHKKKHSHLPEIPESLATTTDDECNWDGTVNLVPQNKVEAGPECSESGSTDSELEVWELEGEELIQNLGHCINKEQELLTTAPWPYYERLQKGVGVHAIRKMGTLGETCGWMHTEVGWELKMLSFRYQNFIW